jgi:hypothetical protein
MRRLIEDQKDDALVLVAAYPGLLALRRPRMLRARLLKLKAKVTIADAMVNKPQSGCRSKNITGLEGRDVKAEGDKVTKGG